VAAYYPYMVSIGNHENSAGSLAHYTERFRNMPSNSGTGEPTPFSLSRALSLSLPLSLSLARALSLSLAGTVLRRSLLISPI
jgi:hypothetical protein